MSTPQIQVLMERAEDSHQAAKVLLDTGFPNYSAAQSYFTMFYLIEVLLYSKGLRFSSHSAVMAAYGKSLPRLRFLTQSFIAALLLQRDVVKPGIMARKAVSPMKKRGNLLSGQRNSCRWSKST